MTMMQTQEDTREFVRGCVRGDAPPCAAACPFGVDVRDFLRKAARGKWASAYKAYRNAVVFPRIVAELCPQPCKNACEIAERPIELLAVENAVLANIKKSGADFYAVPPKAQRVAVYGANYAGLACAVHLGAKQYAVTVIGDFEKLPERHRSEIMTQIGKFPVRIEKEPDGSRYDAEYTAPETRDIISDIVAGKNEAVRIEIFLGTGKYPAEEAASPYENRTAGSPVLTAGQATEEAARCRMCDCSKCFDVCEMLRAFGKEPKRAALEFYTDMHVNPPLSRHSLTREAYSCSGCGACADVCPAGIDLGKMFYAYRKMRAGKNNAPTAFHDIFLRDMEHAGTLGAYVSAGRGRRECGYAFFPGCRLGAMDPRHVTASYEFLDENFSAGIILGCCGAPAYWAGYEESFSSNLEKLRHDWETIGKPVLVLACASCGRMLKNALPEMQTVSLYELLASSPDILPQAGAAGGRKGINQRFPLGKAAIFDPCAAKHETRARAAVRALAARAGIGLSEPEAPGQCCGNGGHFRVANPPLYEQITESRAGESPLPYIVYCSNCKAVFEERGKSATHILDAAFSLDTARTPLIEETRQNRTKAKAEVAAYIDGQKEAPEAPEWDRVRLVLEPRLAESIDRKLIGQDDIREAIFFAERGGACFEGENGVRQCSLAKKALTYWVRYIRLPDGSFEIADAYSHRMRILSGDSK
ncbi:MAG: 4Fe-4S dicluster domain-containing protein [Clostridiales Family XIII bacterium]|jgi:Fe-S oxidoreductase|nr:4Fe-4S dicluster domain-containing protein [Clostridiales Family XIII bacterium]